MLRADFEVVDDDTKTLLFTIVDGPFHNLGDSVEYRTDGLMREHAQGLSDQDLQALATHLGGSARASASVRASPGIGGMACDGPGCERSGLMGTTSLDTRVIGGAGGISTVSGTGSICATS